MGGGVGRRQWLQVEETFDGSSDMEKLEFARGAPSEFKKRCGLPGALHMPTELFQMTADI
jgi:hypothetical protein